MSFPRRNAGLSLSVHFLSIPSAQSGSDSVKTLLVIGASVAAMQLDAQLAGCSPHLTSPHLTSPLSPFTSSAAMVLKYQASCWTTSWIRHEEGLNCIRPHRPMLSVRRPTIAACLGCNCLWCIDAGVGSRGGKAWTTPARLPTHQATTAERLVESCELLIGFVGQSSKVQWTQDCRLVPADLADPTSWSVQWHWVLLLAAWARLGWQVGWRTAQTPCAPPSISAQTAKWHPPPGSHRRALTS